MSALRAVKFMNNGWLAKRPKEERLVLMLKSSNKSNCVKNQKKKSGKESCLKADGMTKC